MCTKVLDASIFVLEKYALNLPIHPQTMRRFRVLIALANTLYKKEFKSIKEERRCPFCGRKFSQRGIRAHLWRTFRIKKCSLQFQSMLNDLATKFVIINNYLLTFKSRHLIPVRVDGNLKVYHSVKELKEAMINDPQVLLAILNDALKSRGLADRVYSMR